MHPPLIPYSMVRRPGTRQRCLVLLLLFNMILEVLAKAIKVGAKKVKDIQIVKGK